MKSLLPIAALAFTAFLSIPQSHAAAPTLENVEWVLVELNGKEFPPPPGNKPNNDGKPTLKFDPQEKLASGRAAPNLYSGRYELKDSTLKIGQGRMTAMGQYPGEQDYMNMLASVTGWRITDGKLELLKADKVVARFSEKAKAGKAEAAKAKAAPDPQLAADGKSAIPPQMALAGILAKGKVISVSDSQSKMTENSSTEVVVSLSQVYRGALKVGNEVKFSIEGWLGSEKKDAEFYRKAKTQQHEVIIPLRKVYNPFLKTFTNNYGGNTYLTNGAPLLATDENMRHAGVAAAIPIGLNFDRKGLSSPWSAVDKAVYRMKDTPAVPVLVCAKTGRPSYLTDGRLEMRVDLLKAAGREPDAAMFGISITNPTDKPIKVESLRSSNGKILWNESVLFVNHSQVWLPMGFDGFTENAEATVIQPGQTLKGKMPWTAQFSFDTLVCLGNLGFSIYINEARNYELYLKDGRHPKPPFQLKTASR